MSEPALPADQRGGAGSCAFCGADVVWAQHDISNLYPGDPASDPQQWLCLDPLVQPTVVQLSSGSALAVTSPSGAVRVVRPQPYQLHVCDPEAMSPQGSYSRHVLAMPCPACEALPGALCLSQRRDVIHSPHGARRAAADGHPWPSDGVEESPVQEGLDPEG